MLAEQYIARAITSCEFFSNPEVLNPAETGKTYLLIAAIGYLVSVSIP
jgi:hypothetical protein